MNVEGVRVGAGNSWKSCEDDESKTNQANHEWLQCAVGQRPKSEW